MYGEEADLCLSARAFSARPAITPAATIIHYGGASERARTDKMVRLLTAKSSLIERHWTPSTIALGRALLAAWPLSRAIATALQSKLFASPGTAAAALAWREIWDRRAEWKSGYTAAPTQAAKPSVLLQSVL